MNIEDRILEIVKKHTKLIGLENYKEMKQEISREMEDYRNTCSILSFLAGVGDRKPDAYPIQKRTVVYDSIDTFYRAHYGVQWGLDDTLPSGGEMPFSPHHLTALSIFYRKITEPVHPN